MLKNNLNTDEIEQLNQISIDIYNGATGAFQSLETMRILLMNVRICTAKLGDNPDARALSHIGEILEESILKVEEATKGGRDASKEIAKLIQE